MNRFLACVLLLLLPLTAEARFRRPALPIGVRMVASLGDLPNGAHPEFVWTVAAGAKKYKLQVLSLTVLSSTATGLDIDAAVHPYPVQFQLSGPPELVDRVVNATERQPMVILAYVRIDAAVRSLILSSVDAGSIAAPPASN